MSFLFLIELKLNTKCPAPQMISWIANLFEYSSKDQKPSTTHLTTVNLLDRPAKPSDLRVCISEPHIV